MICDFGKLPDRFLMCTQKLFRVVCAVYRGIHADVIVYIFAHLHTVLHTEENLFGIY